MAFFSPSFLYEYTTTIGYRWPWQGIDRFNGEVILLDQIEALMLNLPPGCELARLDASTRLVVHRQTGRHFVSQAAHDAFDREYIPQEPRDGRLAQRVQPTPYDSGLEMDVWSSASILDLPASLPEFSQSGNRGGRPPRSTSELRALRTKIETFVKSYRKESLSLHGKEQTPTIDEIFNHIATASLCKGRPWTRGTFDNWGKVVANAAGYKMLRDFVKAIPH